jgi:uncharacterized membrane protein YcaP (DUF421 family)
VPDLAALLAFGPRPLELVLRGTLVYWGLFLLFRFVLRRDTGSLGIADILLLVLIADASQNAMAGGYDSVADGALLVLTIASWSWLMDWASYRFNAVRRFAEPPPLVLVRRGRLVARNLRQEHITVPELMAALREQGIGKLAEVRMARMESDGVISVIRQQPPAEGDDSPGPRARGGLPGAG